MYNVLLLRQLNADNQNGLELTSIICRRDQSPDRGDPPPDPDRPPPASDRGLLVPAPGQPPLLRLLRLLRPGLGRGHGRAAPQLLRPQRAGDDLRVAPHAGLASHLRLRGRDSARLGSNGAASEPAAGAEEGEEG